MSSKKFYLLFRTFVECALCPTHNHPDYINRQILEHSNFDKNRPRVFSVRYVGGQSIVPASQKIVCLLVCVNCTVVDP